MPTFEFQPDLFPGPIRLDEVPGMDKVTIHILNKAKIETLDEVWRLPDRKLLAIPQIGLQRLDMLRAACQKVLFTEYAHERRVYSQDDIRDLAAQVMASGRYPGLHDIHTTVRDEKDPRRTVRVFDGEKTIASIAVTMQRGIEAGLSPLIALYNIVYFDNQPCIWGDVGVAMVQNHPDYAGMTVERYEKGDDWGYLCTIGRYFVNNQTPYLYNNKGDVESIPSVEKITRYHTEEFGLDRATRARLMRLQHYQDYPEKMFEWRAKTNAYRFMFADALRGLSIAEEQRDVELIRKLDAELAPAVTLPTDRFTEEAAKKWEPVNSDANEYENDFLKSLTPVKDK